MEGGKVFVHHGSAVLQPLLSCLYKLVLDNLVLINKKGMLCVHSSFI